MEQDEENADIQRQKSLENEIEEFRLPNDYRLAIKKQQIEYQGSRSWMVMSFFNGLVIIVTIAGSCGLKYQHNKYYEKLTLLDSYDDGSFITLTICIYITCSVINFMGVLIVSVAQNENRRGRMRYMIYAYIGWNVAICAILAGMAIQCIAVLLAMPSLFKDGIFMSMILYGRIPEVANKIHLLQLGLQCCGSFSFEEWFSITWSDRVSKINLNLPKSCCDILHNSIDNCVMQAPFQKSDELTPWMEGCVAKLEEAYTNGGYNVC